MYFVVLSGWIALSILLDDGACQILDFAIPGDFLGFPLLSRTGMYYSARCLTPTEVRGYPQLQLDNAIEHNSKLSHLLCQRAVSDASRAHDHLVNLGLRDARERIAHLLLELYVRLRGHVPHTCRETVRLPLTQGHIGQAVGLTGVHVSRTLRTLREQGVARFINQHLEIINPNALICAAGLEHRTCDDSHEHRTTAELPRARVCAGVASSYLIPDGWQSRPSGAAAA